MFRRFREECRTAASPGETNETNRCCAEIPAKPPPPTTPPHHRRPAPQEADEETPMHRQPLHPVLKDVIIMLSSGVVAALLCTKVYGATLALDEPGPSDPILKAESNKAEDAAAAVKLRTLLAGQRPLMGTVPAVDSRR
jgi:hypothetical protein